MQLTFAKSFLSGISMTNIFQTNPVELKEVEEAILRCLDTLRSDIEPEEFHVLLFLVVFQQMLRSNSYVKETLLDLDRMESFCTKFSIPYGEEFYSIYLLNRPILNRLSQETRLKISEDLLKIHADSQPYIKDLFELIFLKLNRHSQKSIQENDFPQEVLSFINEIFELPQSSSVYNPFSRVGSFGIQLQDGVNYFGQEGNEVSWGISWLRLFSYGKIFDNGRIYGIEVKQEDPIRSWNSKGESYDLIISNPPFGLRVDPFKIGEHGKSRTCEHFVIENGLKCLKPGGKLIAVVSQGFLYSSGIEKDLRKKLIEDDALEAIISFPPGLLEQTSIPFALVVVNTDKSTKGFVRFVDAGGFIEVKKKGRFSLDSEMLKRAVKGTFPSQHSKLVANEQVRLVNYNLSAPRHLQEEAAGTRIGSFASVLKGSKPQNGEQGRIVKIRDLANDSLKNQLKQENLEIRLIPPNFSKISQTCVLVATGWKSLKPTLFEFRGESIFVSKDILTLTLDETTIDTFYFLSELHSNHVKAQVDKYRVGITVPHLRIEDFLLIKIQVPSLEKQREIARRNVQSNTEHLEEGLYLKVEESRAHYEVQNAFLRHSLAGPVANMKGTVESLLEIIYGQLFAKNQEFSSLKISDNHLFTLKEYLEMLDRDSTLISDLVSRNMQKTMDFASKDLSPIDLHSFVKKYAEELEETKKGKYEIDFSPPILKDENGNSISIIIDGNKELLTLLLDNLVENAESHAFQNETIKRIEIFFLTTKTYLGNEEIPEIQILFSNTGKPFPEDFPWETFSIKGASAGPNAGSGLGGWIINEVMKCHKGHWDFIDETGPEGIGDEDLASSFELNFPILEILKHDEI
jgi:type I restriction enzyme M protein